MELLMKVKEAIKGENTAQLTSDMVKIPSYTNLERQEEKIAEYIYRFFEQHGIEVWYQEVEPGRTNVIARLPGAGTHEGGSQPDGGRTQLDGDAAESSGKSLMFCGHMDTVPAYDMEDAFSGVIKDGRVYGRGSCDMKGPIAAMMATLAGIKQSGISLKGDLYFSGLADEENRGKGADKLVEDGPCATATIVGEPTEMNLCLGQKGLEWMRIFVHGKKVHSGNLEQGINAVTMANHFINYLEQNYKKELQSRAHPILGSSTINIGAIKSGTQPSIVPDLCEIALDRRYVQGETYQQIYAELKKILGQLSKEHPDFQAEIESYFKDAPIEPHEPFCTDENSIFVKKVKEGIKRAGVTPKKVTAFPAWTDGGAIHHHTDSQCIIMGPGELYLAHSAKESIAIKELEEAAEIYGMIALEYCEKCD